MYPEKIRFMHFFPCSYGLLANAPVLRLDLGVGSVGVAAGKIGERQ